MCCCTNGARATTVLSSLLLKFQLDRRPVALANWAYKERPQLRTTFLFLLGAASLIADQLNYQKPSKEILDVLNAPTPPVLAVNPTRTYATLSQMVRYPSIAEVSEP